MISRIQEYRSPSGELIVTAFWAVTSKCPKTGMTIGKRRQYTGAEARQILAACRSNRSTENGYRF